MTDDLSRTEKPISRQLKWYRANKNTPVMIAHKKRRAARKKKLYNSKTAQGKAFRARQLAALERWRRSKGIKPRKKAAG